MIIQLDLSIIDYLSDLCSGEDNGSQCGDLVVVGVIIKVNNISNLLFFLRFVCIWPKACYF